MMASHGSLLDDNNPDVAAVGVGMVVGMGNQNPNRAADAHAHAHAAHGHGDRRQSHAMPLALPPLLTITSSTTIPAYPSTNTASGAGTRIASRDRRNTNTNTTTHVPALNDYQAYENDHHNVHDDCDGSAYSDDSAVRQARQHMEEIRILHPVVLPLPTEMVPPLPKAARVLQEPSIPVPRSSRRCTGSSVSSSTSTTRSPPSQQGQVRRLRPPDLVQGQVYQFDNTSNDNDNDTNDMSKHRGSFKDQPRRNSSSPRKLRSDEMLVRCESCHRYLQLTKSAIVVQCPACRAISPAKSTN
jgi:LSD1 subclass zinc finger protein